MDKIKNLEHELERYRKKVADDAKELARLRKLVEDSNQGSQETQQLVDAILTAAALKYGEDARDPDDEGKILGKRLTLPPIDVPALRAGYEIHARRDAESGEYVVGVVPRET